jgi:hypothetical protein
MERLIKLLDALVVPIPGTWFALRFDRWLIAIVIVLVLTLLGF